VVPAPVASSVFVALIGSGSFSKIADAHSTDSCPQTLASLLPFVIAPHPAKKCRCGHPLLSLPPAQATCIETSQQSSLFSYRSRLHGRQSGGACQRHRWFGEAEVEQFAPPTSACVSCFQVPVDDATAVRFCPAHSEISRPLSRLDRAGVNPPQTLGEVSPSTHSMTR